MGKYIALACDFGAHSECEGGDPDEIGDYGTRYGWNECKCPCHKKEKDMIFKEGDRIPKGIREPLPGEQVDGMPVIYVGGHHKVVCDGEWHHRYTDETAYPPDMIFPRIGQCVDWLGGCPTKLPKIKPTA